MIHNQTRSARGRLMKHAAVTAGLVVAWAAPTLAQNYEGPHQVRVGAFLQGGTTTLSGDFTPGPTPPTPFPATTDRGRLSNNGGGVSAGLEFLRARGFSYGVEGDFGFAHGSRGIANADVSTDYFGSLRGRVGFYMRPDWAIYGTGGYGFRGVTAVELSGASQGRTLMGGVYGGGTEFHRGNTIFFAEYLHEHYGNMNVPLSNGDLYAIKGNSDTFRLGVKFKVGFDGYYDEVRDGLRK